MTSNYVFSRGVGSAWLRAYSKFPFVIPAEAGIYEGRSIWMPDQVRHDRYGRRGRSQIDPYGLQIFIVYNEYDLIL
jgi:hypothetical protein